MFLKRQDPNGLVVGMAGAKMGDRLLHVGCPNGGRLAAVASKVGLSGRAIAVVPDEVSAARVRKGAADAGVLVEVEIAPPTRLPVDDASVDLAVVDDTGNLLAALDAGDRAAAIRELARVVRPGGRAIVIGATRPTGLGKLLGGSAGAESFAASGDANAALQADGFKSVRTLAEREGLVFVEGIKPRGDRAEG
jgi:ubiquinone/menaquinone biosynthesis C-methylase UbiE